MKRVINQCQNAVRIALHSYIVVMTTIFLSHSAVAQSETKESRQTDPVSGYVQSNSSSPLVKLYTENRDNPMLKKAIRMEMILNNSGQFPEFSEGDIEAMRNRFSKVESELKQIMIYMSQGDSFDLAQQRHERYTRANDSNTPIVVPGESK